MSILDYTSYDEVRATLGVTATELPDSVIGQPMFSTHVELALEDLAAEIPALYATIKAIPTADASIMQRRFLTLVQLFAPYAAAKHLLTSLPMFAVKSLTDGKAGFDRQNDATIYDAVKADIADAIAEIATRLRTSFNKISGLTDSTANLSFPKLTTAALRGTDPVTNT